MGIQASEIVISGPAGDNGVTIQRTSNQNFRFFHVTASGKLTIENLTLKDGVAKGGDGDGDGGGGGLGGGLFSRNGTVTITNSTFANNSVVGGDTNGVDGSADGGGIFNLGDNATATLTIHNSIGGSNDFVGNVINGDYNGDGVFDNATEHASVAVAVGTNGATVTLTFPLVPAGAAVETHARFRLSTDTAAADETGPASDGEVEDYAIRPPKISINDVTMAEGNGGGTTTFQFTVTRSTTDGAASVMYQTNFTGGSADAADLTPIEPTVLDFADGDASRTIDVLVNADGIVELDETFTVDLSNAAGFLIEDAKGTGTILTDDLPPAPVGPIRWAKAAASRWTAPARPIRTSPTSG